MGKYNCTEKILYDRNKHVIGFATLYHGQEYKPKHGTKMDIMEVVGMCAQTHTHTCVFVT